MSPAHQIAPRALPLVAWALALSVAAGVSMPRLRVPGRERSARTGVARAGSQRPDDPRAWVAPGTEHDPDSTVASEVVSVDAPPATDDGQAPSWLLAPATAAVVPPASRLEANLPALRWRLNAWLARTASGRAPPLV